MLTGSTQVRKTALILFLALSAFYLSLSPGTIAPQGYNAEEMDSGLRLLAVVNAWVKGRPIPPMLWSRHGPIPVLLDLPFLKLGKKVVSPDFMLSFEPVLMTAALAALLYMWLRKVCSPGMSLFLTLTGAFGTMLWPYAYISLETKQSFFVLLAGYLALAGGGITNWKRLMVFAVSCGLALSLKSTGFVLFPAIAYLLYVQLGREWRRRRRASQIVAVIAVIGVIWVVGALGRNAYWGPQGGGFYNLRPWLIDSSFQIFANFIGIFGSPTKGLFVYAPILLVTLYAIPRAFPTHRDTVIFAVLVAGGTLSLLCLLRSPADEVWGSRYMHVVIAPLLVCIAAAWPRFEWRKHAAVAVLAAVGLPISFLGAFYYYGLVSFAAKSADQNTLEWITGDPTWNHIFFNARLFRIWLDDESKPVLWTPKHTWVWTAPPGAPEWKIVNLREFSPPQSFMVRFWHLPKKGGVLQIFVMYVSSLVFGLVFLSWAVARVLKDHRISAVAELTAVVDCAKTV